MKLKQIKSQVHCSIPSDILQGCYQIGLSPSECLDFGIRFKLAEGDLMDYPKNKLTEKIEKLNTLLNEKCQNKNEQE